MRRTAEDASSFGSLFRLIPSPTSWPGSSPRHQWSGASGQSEYRVCSSPRIDSRRCKAYFPYRSRQGWNPSWRPACPPRPLPRLPRNTIAGAFRRLTYFIGPRQTRRDPAASKRSRARPHDQGDCGSAGGDHRVREGKAIDDSIKPSTDEAKESAARADGGEGRTLVADRPPQPRIATADGLGGSQFLSETAIGYVGWWNGHRGRWTIGHGRVGWRH